MDNQPKVLTGADIERLVYGKTKELEALLVPTLLVEHEGLKKIDAEKLQILLSAMAALSGELIGQYEASMPSNPSNTERREFTEGFIGWFERHRGVVYKRFGVTDPVFCIEVVTVEEAAEMGAFDDEPEQATNGSGEVMAAPIPDRAELEAFEAARKNRNETDPRLH